MEGYLFVQSDEDGAPSDIYTKRYFILFPFCGLRWFLQEPQANVSYNKLLQQDDDADARAADSGWVCGGNIKVDAVTIEKAFVLLSHDDMSLRVDDEGGDGNSETIYPFLVKLKCGDCATQVRLATDSEAERLGWVRELHGTESMQTYLLACVDQNVMPSRKVFSAIRNVADRKDVHFENAHLSSGVLGAVVKYVKLSAPHGCMLQSLRCENAHLADKQAALVCALLQSLPHLTALSLAENSFTDQGAMAIAVSLGAMSCLRELDLSSNRIGDAGAEAVVVALGKSTGQLERLDLSRNALTARSVRAMALHLSGHNSHLRFLNLSYNAVGNGAAALVSILMRNKPSVLVDLDLSCTGINEGGIKELSGAIPECESLQHMRLKGISLADPEALMGLVDAVSRHQKEHFLRSGSRRGGRLNGGVGLSLHLGGLRLEQKMPRCLAYRAAKKALPYVDDHTLLRSVVLRRRILVAPNVADDANLVVLPKEAVIPIVSLWVQLPVHIYSAEELVESLARGLGAHPHQLRIVSASKVESLSRACCLECAVEEATPRSVAAMQGCAVVSIYTARLPAERVGLDLQDLPTRAALPSVLELLDALRIHCKEDSPLLRRLGVRSVTLQAPMLAASFEISKSGSGGRLDLPHSDEHIPIITPRHGNHYSMERITDPDDSDAEEEEQERRREREHRTANVYYSSGASDLGADVHAPIQISNLEILKLERDVQRTMAAEREQRRLVSARLVLAVRQLKRAKEIDTSVALFWEGAFGNNKCRSHTIDALHLALNDNGIFHAVGRWNLLCEAMSVRDTPVMAAQIMHMTEDALDGGTALLLGQRLLSEIISLQRDAISLDALASEPDNIAFVESFLLACGKLGYSGPEMTFAADHRKKLILWAAEEHPELIANSVDLIRMRALMSNLMISRDFLGISTALGDLKGEKGQRLGALAEVITARALLRDYTSCMASLVEAIGLRRIPRLEKALAEAAFLGIGLDNSQFVRATRALADLSSVPSKLLKPIVLAMRDADIGRIENALEAAYSMGWRCKALDVTIAPKILQQMKDIAIMDQAKGTLLRLALSVKNGYRVNAGEVLQLLRRANALKLNEDKGVAHHFEQLSKYVKRFAAVLKQEKEIQRKIDTVTKEDEGWEEDLAGLQELLSGRGTGRLVVNCLSEELCLNWLAMLQAAARGELDGQPIKDDEMLMAGSMNKAARSSAGHLHGWRGRYFILQGKALSYYTARNGDRKGVIFIHGGDANRMSVEAAEGRKFAIEIHEGRDMSVLDADLLLEAKRAVDGHLVQEVIAELNRGIAEEALEPLEAALLRVEAGVVVGFDLVRKARMYVKRLRERHLKVQLHSAALTVPRGQMDELVSHARDILIDPNNALLARLVRISEQPDLCQCILRARGAVEMRDEVAFRRAITSLAKFEVKRFSSRDMKMTTAVFLQHTGYRILRANIDGDSSMTQVLLRHVLASCRQLAIETEAMQVAQLLVSISKIATRGDGVETGKTSGLLSYLNDSGISTSMTYRYNIDQFKYLADEEASGKYIGVKDGVKAMGSFFSRLLGQSSRPAGGSETAVRTDLLAYTDRRIKAALLRHDSTSDDAEFIENLARCCFDALQVAMGDRDIKSLKRSKGGQIKMRDDTAFVIADLVEVGKSDHLNPKLKLDVSKLPPKEEAHKNNGDELYVQLCKQLSGHPRILGRLRGWLIFSIYLHAFAPTKSLLPYLRNFIVHAAAIEAALMQESMAKVQAAHEKLLEDSALDLTTKGLGGGDSEADKRFKRKVARQEELEARSSITKIAAYCLKLLSGIRIRDQHDVAQPGEISRYLCATIIGRAKVWSLSMLILAFR